MFFLKGEIPSFTSIQNNGLNYTLLSQETKNKALLCQNTETRNVSTIVITVCLEIRDVLAALLLPQDLTLCQDIDYERFSYFPSQVVFCIAGQVTFWPQLVSLCT
jgi:hypothetical protein